jgi:hypothetical protein
MENRGVSKVSKLLNYPLRNLIPAQTPTRAGACYYTRDYTRAGACNPWQPIPPLLPPSAYHVHACARFVYTYFKTLRARILWTDDVKISCFAGFAPKTNLYSPKNASFSLFLRKNAPILHLSPPGPSPTFPPEQGVGRRRKARDTFFLSLPPGRQSLVVNYPRNADSWRRFRLQLWRFAHNCGRFRLRRYDPASSPKVTRSRLDDSASSPRRSGSL